MPGMALAASVKAGKVWITSPREEVLMTRTLIEQWSAVRYEMQFDWQMP
jgi:hypothetical protein